MKTLFNIFSRDERKNTKKQSQEEKDKLSIIVDIHEKNSLVISELVSLGIDFHFQSLKVGDYIVNGILVERKTISDFISSMINRRLLRQLEEMQQYENRLLIVEGIDEQELYTDPELGKTHEGMHPNSVRGFLLSILLKYKTPILFTKNYSDTARFLSVLSRRKSKDLPLNVRKMKKGF